MKIIYLFVFLNLNLFAQNWSTINLPFYGRVADVSIPSNNKNLIFACGDDGIFKSTNAGISWTQLNSSPFYTSIQVSSLDNNYIITDKDYSTDGGFNWYSRNNDYRRLILAENSKNILFQLDDQYVNGYILKSINILKSTDFGQTWFKILPTRPYHREYSKILTHSANPNLVYVVSSDTLYKSTDLGFSWSKFKYRNSNDDEYVGACLDYKNQDIIYITIKDTIYKSINGGISFNKYYNNSIPLDSTKISQIFSDPKENQILYLENSNNLFNSIDGGLSWNFQYQLQDEICSFLGSVNDNIVLGLSNVGVLKSMDHCESLISIGYKKVGLGDFVALNDNDFYLWSDWIIFKTNNSGNDWKVIAAYYENNIGSLAICPLDTNIIFADEYKSSDRGKTWNKMNIPTSINVVYSIYASNLYIDYVFIRDIYGNLAKSTTNGESWEMVNCPQKIKELYLSTVNKNNLYFISSETNPSLYKSTDLGNTWSKINIALGNNNKINSLSISKYSDDLYLAANSIFRSTDEGENWNKIYSYSVAENYRIEKTYVDPLGNLFSPNVVSNNSLIGSTNKGITWSKSNISIQNNWLDLVYINSLGKVFCFSNDTLFSGFPSIEDPTFIKFLNPQGGENWTVGSQQNIQWQTGNIYQLKIDFSTDNGNKWFPINYTNKENFTWTVPNIPSNNCLLKITSFDSVFAISEPFSIKSVSGLEQVNNNIPSEFNLFQNYPNPFNPSTIIKYTIPNSGKVLIKVYDVLGREIKTLVNKYKDAGAYEIEFDASYLTSGIYFYKITSGNNSKTRKMILMR